MELINYDTFAKEVVKYNSFILDGQLCLGNIFTNDYKNDGIIVLTDFNHMKWVVCGHEINDIFRIEKEPTGKGVSYKIVFENYPSKKIVCYKRNDVESIPAEDCGTDFTKFLDKDIFDDTTSFVLEDNPFPALIIGLDLRKLKLNDRQKCEISKELKNISCYWNPSVEKEPSETLCLMVETDEYSFSFHGLDVNTLDLRLLYISDTYYKNKKVKEYAQEIENAYKYAHRNIKAKTESLKELSELTEIVKKTI